MKAKIEGIEVEMTVDEFIEFLDKTECDCDECGECSNEIGVQWKHVNGTGGIKDNIIMIDGKPYKFYVNYYDYL